MMIFISRDVPHLNRASRHCKTTTKTGREMLTVFKQNGIRKSDVVNI